MWLILILNFIISLKWFLSILLLVYWFRQELRFLFIELAKELAQHIKNLKSVEYPAGKVTFFPPPPPLGNTLPINTTNSTTESKAAYNQSADGYNKGFGPFELQTVVEEGNIIEKQIMDKKCSESDAIGMLISSLAHQNIRNRFLIFDRFITPAQISVLEYLNANILPISEDRLNKFCDRLAGEEKGYTYNSFVGWMVGWKLIEKTPRGFIIAINGRDYLSFRARAGSNVLHPLSEPWQEIAKSLS